MSGEAAGVSERDAHSGNAAHRKRRDREPWTASEQRDSIWPNHGIDQCAGGPKSGYFKTRFGTGGRPLALDAPVKRRALICVLPTLLTRCWPLEEYGYQTAVNVVSTAV